MIAKDDIIIRKSILHVMDTNHASCILSDQLLDPGPDLYEFMRTHIHRLFNSDDMKNCVFQADASPIFHLLTEWEEEDDISFIQTSQRMADLLYTTMNEGLDIPPADLLFVSFQAESIIYLCLLKMNYRESYTHEITVSSTLDENDSLPSSDIPVSKESDTESAVHTSIVKSSSLLPAASARIPEAIIINLSDMHIRLLEKKYEFAGKKIDYLSEKYLICHTDLPPRRKLNILNKVINDISNKYDGADLKLKMDTKSALQREYTDHKTFDVEDIGSQLFGTNPEKKAAFDEKMEQYDLQFDSFTVNNENTVKKLDHQVIVTDSGIEISIPMETYNKIADFDIETDVTGKTTIIIRNIDNLILK